MKNKNKKPGRFLKLWQSPALQQIAQFWQNHRKLLLMLGLVLVVTAVVLPHATALAAPKPPATSDKINELYDSIANFLILAMEFLKRLLWPVLLMIGGLMKNDILFNANMERTMLEIWTNVRNLVNILFVLVLLGIAFYNIMAVKEPSYELKTILPKFVIALIAVNFSFLGVKVVIDAVNVVSTAIFAMPETFTDLKGKELLDTDGQDKFCRGIYGADPGYGVLIKDAGPDYALCDPGGTKKALTAKTKAFFAHFDANNAAVVMALNMGQIGNIDTVAKGDVVKELKTLALNMIFSVVFYIVYASAYLALFFVLLARLVVLWISIVLSPLAALSVVLPDKIKSQFSEASKMSEEFVKHAIVPIPIALTLTIGYIMLAALNGTDFGGSANWGGKTASLQLGTSGMDTLQKILVAACMVGVVWKGVFSAAENTMAKTITGAIKGGVEGAGKFIGTSFKYAPIFPVYNPNTKSMDKPVSLAAGMGALGSIPRSMDSKIDEDKKRLLKMSGFGGDDLGSQLKSVSNKDEWQQFSANAFDRNRSWSKDDQSDLAKKISYAGNNLPSNMKAKDGKTPIVGGAALKAALEKGDVSDETIKKIMEMNKGNKTPESGTPKTEDKAAAAPASPEDERLNKANGIIGEADESHNNGLLTPAELTAFNKAKETFGKETNPAKKAAALAEAEGIASKFEKAKKEHGDAINEASGLKDGPGLEGFVKKREDELKATIPVDTKTPAVNAANKERIKIIIANEVKGLKEKAATQGPDGDAAKAIAGATGDAKEILAFKIPEPVAPPDAPAVRRPAAAAHAAGAVYKPGVGTNVGSGVTITTAAPAATIGPPPPPPTSGAAPAAATPPKP